MKFRKTVAGISALSMLLSCSALTAMTASAADDADYRSTEIKAYLYSYDNVKNIECRFYNDMPNVPYIKLSDYYNCWVDQDLEITNNNDGTYEVKVPIGATGIIDINKETVYSDNYVYFAYPQYIVEGDTSSIDTYIKSEVDAGDPIEHTVDFSEYNIDLRGDDNDIWWPAPTLCDFFEFSLNQASYLGHSLYFCGHPLSDFSRVNIVQETDIATSFLEDYKDGRPKDFAEYNYNELCFAFDNQYGFPGRITYNDLLKETNLDTMLSTANEDTKKIKEMLLSENAAEYCAAFNMLNYYFWDGGHTSFTAIPVYFDEELSNNTALYAIPFDELEGAVDYIADYNNFLMTGEAAKAAREAMYESADSVERTDNSIYCSKGDTAVFTFDSFISDTESWIDYYYNEGELPQDLISEFYNSIIKANNDPAIKNFMIDLGANGGGSIDIVEYMMGLMNDIKSLTVYDSDEGITESKFTVDKNLDKSFDEKDNEFKLDLNIGVITSKASFSCGNLMPALAKEAGYMLVGETSGGGTCAVNFCTTADGLFYSISSGIKFVDSEGKDIDNGIKPDYELVKVNDNGSKDFSEVYSFDKLSKLFKEYYDLPDDPTPVTTTTVTTTAETTTTTTTAATTTSESSATTTSATTAETTGIDTTTVTTTASSATTPAVTTSSTTTTELPQTGNNSAKAATAAGCAALLIVSGGIAVIRSKKED